jgi:hypothetical protein
MNGCCKAAELAFSGEIKYLILITVVFTSRVKEPLENLSVHIQRKKNI